MTLRKTAEPGRCGRELLRADPFVVGLPADFFFQERFHGRGITLRLPSVALNARLEQTRRESLSRQVALPLARKPEPLRGEEDEGSADDRAPILIRRGSFGAAAVTTRLR